VTQRLVSGRTKFSIRREGGSDIVIDFDEISRAAPAGTMAAQTDQGNDPVFT
jgi:hypothetical protein